ncbi:hypothetical protein FB451DRAFT_1387295 [Mycena latifolia]|nr:hypothetical protein FB451DRAFT_1387295 [Mycena latifolia]
MEKRACNGGPPVMGLLRAQEFVSKEGEGQCDAQRDLFAKIMSTMLVRSLTAAGSPPPAPAKFKMVWGPKFLDLAYKNQFKLVNYPTVLADLQFVIGGDFGLKKIGIAQYKEFMPALEKAQLNSRDDEDGDIMIMVPWEDAEKEMSPKEQREIALVSTVNSKTLKAVKDSKAYNDSMAKERAPPVPKKSKSRCSRSCSHRSPSHSRSRARPLPAARERSPVATQGHHQGLRAPSRHTTPLRHEEYELSWYSRNNKYM